jgi:hypothetical protein
MTITDETQRTQQLTITIPLEEAIEGFTAVLPHASKDDVTPIITYVAIVQGLDEPASLVATDRYTVGVFELSAVADTGEGDEQFLVRREVAEWVTKINPKSLRYPTSLQYSVRITNDRHLDWTRVEILDDGQVERSQVFDLPQPGNYPPVLRLLPQTTEPHVVGFVSLKPEFLERPLVYAKKYHKNEAVKFFVTETTNPNKPGPVFFKIGQLSGLIQPNLLA